VIAAERVSWTVMICAALLEECWPMFDVLECHVHVDSVAMLVQ